MSPSAPSPVPSSAAWTPLGCQLPMHLIALCQHLTLLREKLPLEMKHNVLQSTQLPFLPLKQTATYFTEVYNLVSSGGFCSPWPAAGGPSPPLPSSVRHSSLRPQTQPAGLSASFPPAATANAPAQSDTQTECTCSKSVWLSGFHTRSVHTLHIQCTHSLFQMLV